MATTKKKFLTFSQTAFSKTWTGVPTIGIVVRQEFFAVPGAHVGEVVQLRCEDHVGSTVEYKDSFGALLTEWRKLSGGRPI